MDAIISKSQVTFDKFSLIFEVDIDASMGYLKERNIDPNDKSAFAVGEIWLDAGGRREVLIDKWSSHNLIETIKSIAKDINCLMPNPELEKLIGEGCWASWMHEYWHRIIVTEDACQKDEENYEILIGSLILNSKQGMLAAYLYKEKPIIEACLNYETKVFDAWSIFNPARLTSDLAVVADNLSKLICSKAQQFLS